MIAVLTCNRCEETVDVEVEATGDLIPDTCPECQTPWPIDALNDGEVYA